MADSFREYHLYREALLATRADEEIALADIRAYGRGFVGDPDYLRLYGMTPDEYTARGVTLLGRTMIECCIDQYSAVIAAAAARWCSRRDGAPPVGVLDPFVGSGNLLFHVARACGAELALGFEAHAGVCRRTRQNFELIGFPAAVYHDNHTRALSELRARPDWRWIVILCPPWGEAFQHEIGLDLRRTRPPIRELMDELYPPAPGPSPVFVIQTSRLVVEESLAELDGAYRLLERQMRHLIYGGRRDGS